MAHAIQQSSDTSDQFTGVMIHDATPDIHRDVFGGANWDNDVWVAVTAPTGPPIPRNGAATVNVRRFVHTFAPHGEGQGPNLAWLQPIVWAPAVVVGNVPLFDAKFASKQHGNHKDDLLAMVFAVANGGRIRGCIGIVLAVHWVPQRHFFVVSDGSRGSATSVEGGAALSLDIEAGVVRGAIGLLDVRKSDLKAVSLTSGSQKLDLPDLRPYIDELEGTGIAGTFEFSIDSKTLDSQGEGLTIAAEFQDGQRWESGLVPAENFEVSQDLASGCRPGSVKATKWGPWETSQDTADEKAFAAARTAAGKACHGSCDDSSSCNYTEEATELLTTEERKNAANQTEYRSKVKTEGKCECQ